MHKAPILLRESFGISEDSFILLQAVLVLCPQGHRGYRDLRRHLQYQGVIDSSKKPLEAYQYKIS